MTLRVVNDIVVAISMMMKLKIKASFILLSSLAINTSAMNH